MTTKDKAGAAGQAAGVHISHRATPGDFAPSYPRQGAEDRLDELVTHLWGLTATLYGDGGEAFRNCSDEIQDNTLWLVHDLVSQIKRLRGLGV